MSSKSKIRELEGMNNGTSSISKWGDESKNSLYRSKSHLALDDDVYDVPHLDPHLRQDQTSTGTRGIQQGQWELERMGDESKHCLYSWRSHVALDGDVYYVQYLNPHLRQDQTSTSTRGIQQGQWELEGMNNGTNSISKWGDESKHCLYSWRSHVALDGDVYDLRHLDPHLRQDQTSTGTRGIQQGQWETLPPELLLDIIRRVEESETFWPARAVVVYCASVCKSWRSVTKEIIKNLQQCGKITFPISLKQPGPHDHLMQCYIKRNRRTSTFLLYLCLRPSAYKSKKLLLAAKWKRWFEFAISLAADDFSQAKCVGKLRSNFWGTKFTIYDTQPPQDVAVQPNCQSSERFNSKKVSPRSVPSYNHLVSTISYEWLTKTPRRVHCVMNSIPVSAIQERGKSPMTDSYSTSQGSVEPLILKNKEARWNDWCKSWCLDYMGRAIESSGRNFQLVAAVDPSHNVSLAEQERVILNFGKVGKDIFVMEYAYPLSAFQAFAICLTSFICNMYKSKCRA